MPIPKPNTDEKETDFISRCMGDSNMQEYEQIQRAGICYTQWREKDKEKLHCNHPEDHVDGDPTKPLLSETKSEGDGNHPASHYLVVEDPKAPSTWHLRVRDKAGNPDHGLMGSAWAALHGGYRGNKYEGPKAGDALAKLKSLYKEEKMDTPDEQKASETLSDVKDGLVRIALAYTGSYERGGRKFTITESDLKSIVKNLKPREVPIDYEHLSADPKAPPGHSRASGWIKAPDRIEPFMGDKQILYGWAQFTPASLVAIRSTEYKYFSPEIQWNDIDENGKDIGTRLAAGGLTNRPFLKSLPPIEIGKQEFPQLLEAVALSEHKRLVDVGDVHVPAVVNSPKPKGDAVKKFKMKKFADGDNQGDYGIYDGDECVGMVDASILKKMSSELHATELSELEELRKMKTKVAKMEASLAELHELRQVDLEELAELRKLKARTTKGGDLYIKHEGDDDDLSKLTEVVRLHERTQTDALCLTELSQKDPGEQTLLAAEQMMLDGKMSSANYIRFQRIERLIDGAISKGKIKPSQRKSTFKLAIGDYESTAAFLNEIQPGKAVDLTTHGVEGDGDESGRSTEILKQKTAEYMREHKVEYHEALRAVTLAEPQLWQRHVSDSVVLREEGR